MSIGTIDSSTLICLGTTTTEVIADDVIDQKVLEGTVTATATTSTTLGVDVDISISTTKDYFFSMNNQQIEQMLAEVDEQEAAISCMAEDTDAKVKTIGIKSKF